MYNSKENFRRRIVSIACFLGFLFIAACTANSINEEELRTLQTAIASNYGTTTAAVSQQQTSQAELESALKNAKQYEAVAAQTATPLSRKPHPFDSNIERAIAAIFAYDTVSQAQKNIVDGQGCTALINRIANVDRDNNPATPQETKGQLITVGHCVRGANAVIITTSSGYQTPIEIANIETVDTIPNETQDYPTVITFYAPALLSDTIGTTNIPLVPDSQIGIGTQVSYCGYPAYANPDLDHPLNVKCETTQKIMVDKGFSVISPVTIVDQESGSPVGTSMNISGVVVGCPELPAPGVVKANYAGFPEEIQQIADTQFNSFP